jgi:hypothetical protein
LYDAWIVTWVDAVTASVVTVKVAEVAPCNTVTDPGTVATAWFRLIRFTMAPPAGAGALSVTVPSAGVPWTTVVGFRATELKLAAPVTDSLSPAIARRRPTKQRAKPIKRRELKKASREVDFVVIVLLIEISDNPEPLSTRPARSTLRSASRII